ncbi:MAG: hypothetical protein QXS54_01250 [Candidatus Methanomethylicaceae archaeon]
MLRCKLEGPWCTNLNMNEKCGNRGYEEGKVFSALTTETYDIGCTKG